MIVTRVNTNAAAWLLMVTAVAFHVLDEAVTGFLPFFNQTAVNIRERIAFFPVSELKFGIWLSILIAAITIRYLLTPVVRRGGRFIRAVTTVLGILMIVNSLGHMLGSLFTGRLLPGFWSSPPLLLTALFVVVRGFRGDWQRIKSSQT